MRDCGSISKMEFSWDMMAVSWDMEWDDNGTIMGL